jgi:hypothetical protein
MKRILLFCTLIIVSCCKTAQLSYKNEDNNYLIKEFKQVYFSSCLKHGFNNSNEIRKILLEDKSGTSDFSLGLKNYNIIDSLAKISSKKIIKDSIESLTKRAEGSRGKRVLKQCLEDYTSKWLDSIANSRLK